MKKTIIVGGILGILLSFTLGFFIGREYLRHELKSSFQEVSENMTNHYLERQEEQLNKELQEYQENYRQAMEQYEQNLEEQEDSGEYRFGVTPPIALPME